jgi:prepilin-type N-terminal cleavage/methylation domain-containing protein
MAKALPCFQRETRNPCFKPETRNTKPATLCFNTKHETQNTKHLMSRIGLCGKTGFTLVEIVVSITILAIVFLSLYQFFFKSYSFSRNVCQKENALLLARKKAEHTLAGIEAEYDTVTIDTLDNIIYKTVMTSNKEIPASCSIKVYVNKKEILVIQLLKP